MAENFAVPAGYRLQPLSEAESVEKIIKQNEDLALLVVRLSRKLLQKDHGNSLSLASIEYLRSNDLLGKGVLRSLDLEV